MTINNEKLLQGAKYIFTHARASYGRSCKHSQVLTVTYGNVCALPHAEVACEETELVCVHGTGTVRLRGMKTAVS